MGNHEIETLLDRSPPSQRKRYFYQLPYSTVHPDDLLNYVPEGTIVTSNMTRALDTLYNLSLNEVYGKNKFRSIDFSPYGRKSICNLISDPALSEMVRDELSKLQEYYISAFSSSAELGRWVEKRPITHQIDDLLFLHGGLDPGIFQVEGGISSSEALSELNDKFHKHSNDKDLAAFMSTLDGKIVYSLLTHRGNHNDCSEVAYARKVLGISKVIVGHTPDEKVRVRCQGRFLAIDGLLGRYIRTNGNQYCRGKSQETSSNGRFRCEEVSSECGGQIVKLSKKKAGSKDDWKMDIIHMNN